MKVQFASNKDTDTTAVRIIGDDGGVLITYPLYYKEPGEILGIISRDYYSKDSAMFDVRHKAGYDDENELRVDFPNGFNAYIVKEVEL